MTRISKIASLIAVAVALCVAGAAFAQATTTRSSTKSGTVLAKYDGKVVVKMDDGTDQGVHPAPGKTIMVNGVPTNYDDPEGRHGPDGRLRQDDQDGPGHRRPRSRTPPSSRWSAARSSSRTRTATRATRFPPASSSSSNGKEMALQDLGPGMKLTATIVSKSTKTVSESEIKGAAGVAPAAPAPAPKAAAAPPPPAPTAAPAPPPPAPAPAPAKKLPKTGSPLPLAALGGALSLLAGLGLRSFRRSR